MADPRKVLLVPLADLRADPTLLEGTISERAGVARLPLAIDGVVCACVVYRGRKPAQLRSYTIADGDRLAAALECGAPDSTQERTRTATIRAARDAAPVREAVAP